MILKEQKNKAFEKLFSTYLHVLNILRHDAFQMSQINGTRRTSRLNSSANVNSAAIPIGAYQYKSSGISTGSSSTKTLTSLYCKDHSNLQLEAPLLRSERALAAPRWKRKIKMKGHIYFEIWFLRKDVNVAHGVKWPIAHLSDQHILLS